MDGQKLANTPLTKTHFLLLIPAKAFTTGISSSVHRLFAATSLEVCSPPRVGCGQKPGILCFVPLCFQPATHIQEVILGTCSVSTQCGSWVHFPFAVCANSLWAPVWRQGTPVKSSTLWPLFLGLFQLGCPCGHTLRVCCSVHVGSSVLWSWWSCLVVGTTPWRRNLRLSHHTFFAIPVSAPQLCSWVIGPWHKSQVGWPREPSSRFWGD